MALNYATGYGGGSSYRGPLSKTDIQTDVFSQFEKSKKALEDARLKAEKDRQERLNLHKEMRGQIEELSTTNMYDGHYNMLQEAAKVLSSEDTINKYASTPDGQAQYESMVQQLNDAIDHYENYYKSTYGSSQDQATLSTYNAAYTRSLTPEMNAFEQVGYESTVGWDQVLSNYNALQGQQHRQGSVRIQNGQLMFDGLDGKSMGILDTPLDMKVFDPGLQVMDMSGYKYFMSRDDGKFQTEQAVRDYIKNAITDNDVNLVHALRHYSSTNNIQTNYQDLLSDDDYMNSRMDQIVKLWQDEAVEAWKGRRVKEKPSESDKSRFREDKERQKLVESALRSVNIEGYAPSMEDEDFVGPTLTPSSGVSPGSVWSEITGQTSDDVSVVPQRMTFPLPLPDEIEVEDKSSGTLVSIKVGKIIVDNQRNAIVLEGTTTKTSTALGAETDAVSIPIDVTDPEVISEMNRQLRTMYGYDLKQLLEGITGVDGIPYEGRVGVRNPNMPVSSGQSTQGSATRGSAILDSIGG